MKIRIKRGLDLSLPGPPEQRVDEGNAVRTAALIGDDYEGLRPALAVEQGEQVRLGQALFTDRRHPDVRFTAPASGRVAAIHRGERRRLVSVVVEIDDRIEPMAFESFPREQLRKLSGDRVRRQLLGSGLWTALRSRPFDRVPGPDAVPAAIIVTALDTSPLAADPAVIIAQRPEAFADGVAVLARIAKRVCVCTAPGTRFSASADDGTETVEFGGGHPAGLPGTQIAALAPVSDEVEVWHLGYQDVIAIGELFVQGRLSGERIVAVGGPAATRPRLLRTCTGASLDDLLADETREGARIVSGSALAGRRVRPETAYLGRYATQVSILEEPGGDAGRAGRSVRSGRAGRSERAGRSGRPSPSRGTTALHGRPSGMLAVEAFERVWPFRMPVLPLLRALLVGDVDTASALGCLNLAEEDMALCSYVCPAKLDYGAALRAMLRQLEAEAPR